MTLDSCIWCGKRITEIKDFSIDHIEPWLDNDPALFWDLDNIGFAHLGCNSKAARRQGHYPYVMLGEAHKDARVTEVAVRDIRHRYSVKKRNGVQLAREYDVTPSTIYDIINGTTWKQVDGGDAGLEPAIPSA